jgi:hypothetical protein
MLELVEATEEELATQGRGRGLVAMGEGPGASTQVRGSGRLHDVSKPL